MSAVPTAGTFDNFVRAALLRLTGEDHYQPLELEALRAEPLAGRLPIVLSRGYRSGMAVNFHIIAICPADGLTPVDFAARADALAEFVRRVGEQGNADARAGGSGRQVSALLIWVFAAAVSSSDVVRAASLQRSVRGSSFGQWPLDCASVTLANGQVRLPLSPPGRWRARLAGELVQSWRDATSPAATEMARGALSETRGRRDAFGRLLQARATPATTALLVLVVLFFLAMELSGGSTRSPVLLRFGALVPDLVRQGQWWRVVSAAFLHIGWAHIFFNGWALYLYGPIVERLYGKMRFLGIYLIAAIAGDLLSLPFVNGISAGASGAIFGLLGVTIALLVRYRRQVPAGVRDPLLKNAVVVVGINVVLSLAVAGINLYAHAGGFIAGAICGLLFRPTPLVDGKPQGPVGAAVGVGVGIMAIAALVADVLSLVGTRG